MNVRELKAALKHAKDEMEIVVPGSDHSYERVLALSLEKAEVFDKRKVYLEYYDDANKSDPDSPVEVVVVLR
jgi:hypothetical protein